MRRADRLYRLIEALRGRSLLRARDLAARLEVSERTVYRDVAVLITAGVPIQGEAGVGYRLLPGFFLPPVMFEAGEVEGLALGLRMAEAWGGKELGAAAQTAWAKIEAVLPAQLRRRLAETPLYAPAFHVPAELRLKLDTLRRAVGDQRVLEARYCDRGEAVTQRRIWPLGLHFWGQVWTLGAWCELRVSLRTFRVDRLQTLVETADRFPQQPGRRLADYLAQASAEGLV